jgi:hypothetical protein
LGATPVGHAANIADHYLWNNCFDLGLELRDSHATLGHANYFGSI